MHRPARGAIASLRRSRYRKHFSVQQTARHRRSNSSLQNVPSKPKQHRFLQEQNVRTSKQRETTLALARFLRSLGLPRGLVVGAEELQQSSADVDILANARALVDLMRRYSFPEDRLPVFLSHNSMLALSVPAERFSNIFVTLERSLDFSRNQVGSIVCHRSGLDILEIASRYDSKHVREIFELLKAEYNATGACTMVSRNPGFLRFTASWLQDSLDFLRAMFPVEHVTLAERSHGAVLLVSSRTRQDAFEFYRTHVFRGSSRATRAAALTNWRLLTSTNANLSRAHVALVDLLGENEARRVLIERPALLTRLNPDTLKVLSDLGYDVRNILSSGKASQMLAVPPMRVTESFQWLCEKLGKHQALRLSRYLSLNARTNLDPTWNALIDLGVSPADLASHAGIELLQFSVKNVVLPFRDLLSYHCLTLSSAELVNALRSLTPRIIKDLHSRIQENFNDAQRTVDRSQILLAAKRSRTTKLQHTMKENNSEGASPRIFTTESTDDCATEELDISQFSNSAFLEKHPCSGCDKVFSSALLLKRHRARHIYSYQCDMCLARFKLPGLLKSHKQRKHTRLSARGRFECHCGDWFTDEKSLASHVEEKGGDHVSSQSRAFKWSDDPQMFPASFPVTNQSVLHSCTLETGKSILRRGVLASSEQSDKSPRSSLDFALARDDAPPISFFSVPTENEGPVPPFTMFPSSAEAGELCARVHVDLDSLLDSGDYRIYFVGLGNVQARMYRTNARALVLFADRSAWSWADEHCVRLDQGDNSLLFRTPRELDEASSQPKSSQRFQWSAATRVCLDLELQARQSAHTNQPSDAKTSGATSVPMDELDAHSSELQRPLQVTVAVSGDIDLNTVENRWSLSARMRQVNGEIQCPFCEYAAPSTQYARCRDHILSCHCPEEFIEHPDTGKSLKVGTQRWRSLIASEPFAEGSQSQSAAEGNLNHSQYSLEFKLDALNWHKANGKDCSLTAVRFNLPEATLKSWIQMEKRLRTPLSSASLRKKHTKYDEVFKQRVLDWYRQNKQETRLVAHMFDIPYRTLLKWIKNDGECHADTANQSPR